MPIAYKVIRQDYYTDEEIETLKQLGFGVRYLAGIGKKYWEIYAIEYK